MGGAFAGNTTAGGVRGGGGGGGGEFVSVGASPSTDGEIESAPSEVLADLGEARVACTRGVAAGANDLWLSGELSYSPRASDTSARANKIWPMVSACVRGVSAASEGVIGKLDPMSPASKLSVLRAPGLKGATGCVRVGAWLKNKETKYKKELKK